VFARRLALEQPKRPAPAPAGAVEKAPAATVRETDVLEADEEGKAVREGDGGGRIVGVDEAGGPHAGGADVGEIVDRCPHEEK
jgi:hypothetical protein